MKKITLPSELAYLLGMLLLPLGIAFLEKADFGMSTISAPAYLFSLKFEFLTFGAAEYCLQAILLLITCLIVRRFRISYLFSFITAFLYGNILDFYLRLLQNLSPGIAERLCFFAGGILATALGVSFFFHTYIAPAVYELFVKEVSLCYHRDMGKFKICFDCGCLLLALILSFLFFGKLKGIQWGTFVCAVVNGAAIGAIGKLMDRYLLFTDKLPLKKYFVSEK